MRLRQYQTVYQITLMPNAFPVNCYLVEEPQELTLIDAALAMGWRDILRAAASIGKPITRILLTHPHADHVGALDYLKAALPHAPVLMSERDSALLCGDLSLRDGEEASPIRGGFVKGLKTRADTFLKDGDSVGSLRVLFTPGHTPGSLSFYDERTKALIVGDALQTRGGMAVAGDKRFWFPFPAAATWSPHRAIESAKRLNELDVRYLATGHGNVVENPAPSIAHIIHRAEAALQRKG